LPACYLVEAKAIKHVRMIASAVETAIGEGRHIAVCMALPGAQVNVAQGRYSRWCAATTAASASVATVTSIRSNQGIGPRVRLARSSYR
jgi:hypothetical protein